MKFKFIGNTCGIFLGSKGTKILCDPWIIDHEKTFGDLGSRQ